MVWYHGRWHRYSEAERREYGERKREEWRRRWHAQWLSRRGLKARLWTDKAIADFLPGAQPAGRIRAWPRSVVLAAEQTPAFQARLAKRRARLDARCRLPGVIYATYGLLAIGWHVSAPDRPVRYQRRVWNEVKQDRRTIRISGPTRRSPGRNVPASIRRRWPASFSNGISGRVRNAHVRRSHRRPFPAKPGPYPRAG
uniref:hypothetical protein n=1 Tax=Salmonella enterica TaxID=28901 RepID=UPI001B3580EF|nr:hypothetical protein [Salmonella enterica]